VGCATILCGLCIIRSRDCFYIILQDNGPTKKQQQKEQKISFEVISPLQFCLYVLLPSFLSRKNSVANRVQPIRNSSRDTLPSLHTKKIKSYKKKKKKNIRKISIVEYLNQFVCCLLV
jgi:hypothetical protein